MVITTGRVRLNGFIPEINYTPTMVKNLEIFDESVLLTELLAQKASVVLQFKGDEYGLSQWVSPKRTRSYPYSRVYDTFVRKNRITIIPFVKDEGFDGDRDFIQWDTVSLMSLLNVYVIVAYYHSAVKNIRYSNKITNQVYDYEYIRKQIEELTSYQSSALHWNLHQMDNLLTVAENSRRAYDSISQQLSVIMHSEKGIDDRIQVIRRNVYDFRELSRDLAVQAQNRETQTIQPKERVIEDKVEITLKNFLGGYYFFTVDEYMVIDDTVFLIEKKHSGKKLIPSANDIKDSFIKMALFTNISDLNNNNNNLNHKSVVGLTSSNFKGYCHSQMKNDEIENIFNRNQLTERQSISVKSYINEARQNDFLLFIMDSKCDDYQQRILHQSLII